MLNFVMIDKYQKQTEKWINEQILITRLKIKQMNSSHKILNICLFSVHGMDVVSGCGHAVLHPESAVVNTFVLVS